MPPDRKLDIAIVTLNCPKCPRIFRTMAWIAFARTPTCPSCEVRMECSEVQDVSVLGRKPELSKRA